MSCTVLYCWSWLRVLHGESIIDSYIRRINENTSFSILRAFSDSPSSLAALMQDQINRLPGYEQNPCRIEPAGKQTSCRDDLLTLVLSAKRFRIQLPQLLFWWMMRSIILYSRWSKFNNCSDSAGLTHPAQQIDLFAILSSVVTLCLKPAENKVAL